MFGKLWGKAKKRITECDPPQSPPELRHKESTAPPRTKVCNLRQIFEVKAADVPEKLEPPCQRSQSENSKVQRMVSLYDSGIWESLDFATYNGNNSSSDSDYSPKAKLEKRTCVAKENLLSATLRTEFVPKGQQNSHAFFVPEDNSMQLTVKDKVHLYNQFAGEVSEKNPSKDKKVQVTETLIKKDGLQSEVVSEKQESVKYLLAELEARCAFPKQTISPRALQMINIKKNKTNELSNKSNEFENLVTGSTCNVKLQPNSSQNKAESHKSDNQELFKDSELFEYCPKRKIKLMRPVAAHALLQEVRSSGAEGPTQKISSQREKLEDLFFIWLKERNLMELKQTFKTKRVNEMTSNPAADKDVDSTTAKWKYFKFRQSETNSSEMTAARPQLSTTTQSTLPASHYLFDQTVKCEFGSDLSSLTKTTSDDSHTDAKWKENENSAYDFTFPKTSKVPRKKKYRRTLTWLKGSCPEETIHIHSSESDSDYQTAQPMYCAESQTDELPGNELPTTKISGDSDSNSAEAKSYAHSQTDESVENVLPPATSSEESENNIVRKTISPQEVKSAPSPRACQKQNEMKCNEIPLRTFSASNISGVVQNVDSYSDQGFETGSNMDSPLRDIKRLEFKRQKAMSVWGPLFVKLSPEDSSGFSTTLKEEQLSNSPSNSSRNLWRPVTTLPLKRRRKSTCDSELRRSSSFMQVIREDQPLNHYENSAASETSTHSSSLNLEKASHFWIKCGDFSISFDVCYNSLNRLRLLHEIFSKKCCDYNDLHFGIDNFRFSVEHAYDRVNVLKNLPNNKEHSYYWFSTGDLAIPFSGKFLTKDKIPLIFTLLNTAATENGILRFGVDAIDFSNVSDYWNKSPSFSMGSNYSMLVGLQSGDSNGLEGRSKYAWPRSKPVSVSDVDPTDDDYEDYAGNGLRRQSFSPQSDSPDPNPYEHSLSGMNPNRTIGEPFDFGSKFESLERLFDTNSEGDSNKC